MKTLIKHLVRNHLDEITKNTIINCHAQGVDSILLIDKPEYTIRLYIARTGSDLYHNLPQLGGFVSSYMTVGFHPHHSALTLEVIQGTIYNWSIRPDDKGNLLLDQYYYHSGITENEVGFELMGQDVRFSTLEDCSGWLDNTKNNDSLGNVIDLPAHRIHTIGAPRGLQSAWFVYEGKKDYDYKPFTYSTANLLQLKSEGLYQKPFDSNQVKQLLKSCKLL